MESQPSTYVMICDSLRTACTSRRASRGEMLFGLDLSATTRLFRWLASGMLQRVLVFDAVGPADEGWGKPRRMPRDLLRIGKVPSDPIPETPPWEPSLHGMVFRKSLAGYRP